jgi:hypothetical protein
MFHRVKTRAFYSYLSPGWAETLLWNVLENRFLDFLPEVDILVQRKEL